MEVVEVAAMEVEAELVEEVEKQQVVEEEQEQMQGREAAAAAFIAPAAKAAEAEAVGEAAEAEAVGGLPGLLRSPSLAGLYVRDRWARRSGERQRLTSTTHSLRTALELYRG